MKPKTVCMLWLGGFSVRFIWQISASVRSCYLSTNSCIIFTVQPMLKSERRFYFHTILVLSFIILNVSTMLTPEAEQVRDWKQGLNGPYPSLFRIIYKRALIHLDSWTVIKDLPINQIPWPSFSELRNTLIFTIRKF